MTRPPFLLLAALVLAAGCQSMPMPPLPLAQSVDIDRFMGDWYVIAATPTWIDWGAEDAVESYRREADGSIAVTYTFRGEPGGELKTYQPRGFIEPGSGNAVWGMQFVWPFRADYRIAWLAPDYSRVVVAREKRDYAWIMARRPSLPDAQVEEMFAFLRANGYDTATLRRMPQSVRGGSR
jgi:apolipoprotein D and lipocalin family protein